MKRVARYYGLIFALSGALWKCTYDSTPPGDDKINDSKPLLMLDATGLSASRSVRLQYTDAAGSTTQQTAAEKTDSSGRFLYPLYLTRGTRSFTLTVIVDESGDGNFCTGGDKTYTQNSNFSLDTDIKNLQLSAASFAGC